MPDARRQYIQWVARVGYAARGLVFVIMACFTSIAAFDAHTKPVDGKDALQALLRQPFGSVLLIVVFAGLLCFAIWREAQFILDADRLGSGAKGLARRAAYGAAGLFYVAFALVSLSTLVGVHTASTERVVHDWTGWLLSQRFGDMAVIAIGVAIIVTGVGIGVAGVRAEFRNRIALRPESRRWVIALGRAGYLTRAAMITLIGVFVTFAALHADAHEATGIAGALLAIQHQPYGAALLAVTAAGLLAFGIYGWAEALYRRIDGRCITTKVPAWLSV